MDMESPIDKSRIDISKRIKELVIMIDINPILKPIMDKLLLYLLFLFAVKSKKDLKELSEEGIDAQILPWVKDNSN